MSIFVLIRSGEIGGQAKPICASDNPRVAEAALAAMLTELRDNVPSTPTLESLGILEPQTAADQR